MLRVGKVDTDDIEVRQTERPESLLKLHHIRMTGTLSHVDKKKTSYRQEQSSTFSDGSRRLVSEKNGRERWMQQGSDKKAQKDTERHTSKGYDEEATENSPYLEGQCRHCATYGNETSGCWLQRWNSQGIRKRKPISNVCEVRDSTGHNDDGSLTPSFRHGFLCLQ